MLDFVLHVTKMIINLQYACNDDKNNHWIVIILVQIMLRNISEEHMAVTPILGAFDRQSSTDTCLICIIYMWAYHQHMVVTPYQGPLTRYNQQIRVQYVPYMRTYHQHMVVPY